MFKIYIKLLIIPPPCFSRTKRVYSRVSDTYVSRPVKVAKNYPYVRQMMEAMVDLRMSTTMSAPVAPAEDDPRVVCPYVHRLPRPDESAERLEEIRALHSRFGTWTGRDRAKTGRGMTASKSSVGDCLKLATGIPFVYSSLKPLSGLLR